MTLKINYLDRIKDLSKNMALFLGKDAKIPMFFIELFNLSK